MATNPSTLPENIGRITAPSEDYPFGSAKDDSTGTTGDGTPFKSALLNDIFGFQQALLTTAGITPSGNPDTAEESQYLQAMLKIQSNSRNELLRALVFTPLLNAGAGYTPNSNFVASCVGQKCYVSEYETTWSLVQTLTNTIDEATKAASILDGSRTYAGWWGYGSDETGAYFTTPNWPEFENYSAGTSEIESNFFAGSVMEHSHVTGFTADNGFNKESQKIGRMQERLYLEDGDVINNYIIKQINTDLYDKYELYGTGNAGGITARYVTETEEELTITGSKIHKNELSTIVNDKNTIDRVYAAPKIWLPKGVY